MLVRVGKGQHGLSIFAAQDIPEGTIWWEETAYNVVPITRAVYRSVCASHMKAAGDVERKLFVGLSTFTYYCAQRDCLMLAVDYGRFTNHTDEDANSRMVTLNIDFEASQEKKRKKDQFRKRYSVTVRNIKEGEEITENYKEFDPYPWPEPWDDFSEEEKHVAGELRAEYLRQHPEELCPAGVWRIPQQSWELFLVHYGDSEISTNLRQAILACSTLDKDGLTVIL